jgi:hypothetical protein
MKLRVMPSGIGRARRCNDIVKQGALPRKRLHMDFVPTRAR